jgi:pyruvate,water dikinase
MDDVELVGGKNASLGEMIRNLAGMGVRVPGGFATTSAAYRDFLRTDKLDERIHAALESLDVDDIDALNETGQNIRNWITQTELPERLKEEIRSAWDEMSRRTLLGHGRRSSRCVLCGAAGDFSERPGIR